MEVELTGVNIQQNGLNKCHVDGCQNDSCTAVRNPDQFDVCAWHLKEKIESGEWEIKGKK